MTGLLYTSLPFAEGSLPYTAIKPGHSLRGKLEENTAGAEDSKTSGLGLKKAVIFQRKKQLSSALSRQTKHCYSIGKVHFQFPGDQH